MTTLDGLVERSRRGINCVVPPVPVVTVDKLRVSTHRAVWRELVGPLGPTDYLLQNCKTKGCVLPRHHEVSPTPYRRQQSCRNGHRYDADSILPNGTRVCAVCADRRKLRRDKGGKPYWQIEKQRKFCPQGTSTAWTTPTSRSPPPAARSGTARPAPLPGPAASTRLPSNPIGTREYD